MAYRDNVSLMCRLTGVSNPIHEDAVGITRLVFRNEWGDAFIVDATDMNRAGRLFFQNAATLQNPLNFDYVLHYDFVEFSDGFKEYAREFFSEIWEDSSPTNRTLLYGIATYTSVEIFWKEGFFD